MKKLLLTLVTFLCVVFVGESQITINSLVPTTSSCPNNGSITVDAVNSSGNALFYSIVAGPTLQSDQTNNTFTSLLPGPYTVRVSDLFGNSETSQVTVNGSYSSISFNPQTTPLTCSGIDDGTIKGNIGFGGLAPFSWELIAPSPVVRGSQGNDLFEGLSPGEYTVRVTDDCGAFDTRVVTIEEKDQSVPLSVGVSYYANSCSSGSMNLNVFLSDVADYSAPYTVTITNSSNTVLYSGNPISELVTGFGIRASMDVDLTGVSYGEILNYTVSNDCGVSSGELSGEIGDFQLCENTSVENNGCSYDIVSEFTARKFLCSNGSVNNITTYYQTPITYELLNKSTNVVEDSGEIGIDDTLRAISISSILPNEDYAFSYTDQCGNSNTIEYTSPNFSVSGGTPYSEVSLIEPSQCMDSTASVDIEAYNFASKPEMVLLSGPSEFSSTKEKLEYSHVINYPVSIESFSSSSSNGGARVYTYSILSLPIGDYTYEMVDTCGNVVPGSFEIVEDNLSDIYLDLFNSSDCFGNNFVGFGLSNSSTGIDMRLRNFSSGFDESVSVSPSFSNQDIGDTIFNVPPGDYTVYINNRHFSNESVLEGGDFCFSYSETIEIQDYENPQILSYNQVVCEDDFLMEILIDSSKGNAPYEFEIISGPQTFSIQAENVFSLNDEGIYRTRIYDACGNASIRDISIEKLEFEPVNTNVSCQSAEVIFPLSDYYSYLWTKPDESTFTGNVLSLDNITTADTGLYIINQEVSLGGCTEMFIDSVYIESHTRGSLFDTICPGETYTFGLLEYTESGIYLDTVTTTEGCDSIVSLHLNVLDYNRGTTSETICPGGSISVGGLLYTQPGLYNDTLTTMGCDSIVTYDVSFSPYLMGTVNREICSEASVLIEGELYDTPGIYSDTISNGFCDSVLTINITGVDFLWGNVEYTICEDDFVVVNGENYSLPGVYYDTIPTSTCDSILAITIFNLELPTVSLGKDTSLCENETINWRIKDGFNNYLWGGEGGTSNQQSLTASESGIYWVEVTNSFNCLKRDSIEVVVHSNPTATVSDDTFICEGDEVSLTANGGEEYFWSPDNLKGQSVLVSPRESTLYTVVVIDDNNCSDTTETQVDVNAFPAGTVLEEQEITNCFFEDDLELELLEGNTYLWEPSLDTNSSIIISSSGSYFVTVTNDKGCDTTQSFDVIDFCEALVLVPDAFSPNNDLVHDKMEVFGKNFTDFELRIFNRWGEVIFMTNDINDLWDGHYKGELMPQGSYPWVINYKTISSDESLVEEKRISGGITIIW